MIYVLLVCGTFHDPVKIQREKKRKKKNSLCLCKLNQILLYEPKTFF